MKNLITLSIIVVLSFSAKAQIQKGAILTDGSIGFNSHENELEQSNGVSSGSADFDFLELRPRIGIFITESLLLSMGIQYEYNYSRSSTNLNNFISRKTNLILVNPNVQKFYKLTDNLFFSPTLNLLIGGGNLERREVVTEETDIFDFSVNLAPGLTYFLSEKWAVATSFGQLFYNRRRTETESTPSNLTTTENIVRNYGFNLNFNSFSIAVQYYLRNNPG